MNHFFLLNFLSFFYTFFFFCKFKNLIFNKNLFKSDVVVFKNKPNFFKKIYFNVNLTLLINYLLLFYFLKFNSSTNSNFLIYISNFNLNAAFYFLSFILIAIYLIKKINFFKLNVQIDLIFFIFTMFYTIAVSFFCKNVLSLFFLIEFINYYVFYLVSSSKNFNSTSKEKDKYNNAVYVYFWSNFLSGFMFIYFSLICLNVFGSCDFFFLNFFFENNIKTGKANYDFSLTILVISFLIKLGLGPFFFWKMEFFKGMPLLSIFFYNIFFIFFYIIVFIILFNFFINFFFTKFYMYIIFTLIVSFVFIFFNSIDSYFINNFLSYSSSFNILLVTISITFLV